MKLYLFLRELIWTSILSVASTVASLILAFIDPQLAIPFGLAAISLAVLAPRAER